MMNESPNNKADVVKCIKAYIAANLHQVLTAKDLAQVAGYSQYHMARVFKEVTGIAPFEYIRCQRMLHSAYALRGENVRVLDVALDYVFDSHEGFTRAFTKAFGISPKKYAKCKAPEGWLIPFRYLNRSKSNLEELNMEQTTVIFSQIIERPARKLILKRSKNAHEYFSYCEEVGCGNNNNSAAWDVLCEIKEALYEPVGLWLPDSLRPEGTGVYAHGVEVPFDFKGELAEGFEIIDLAPCKYLVFQGEPYDDKDFDLAIRTCMESISRFNPEVYGYQWAPEDAPKMQLSPEGWRGYIEMYPVKEKK
jgi:AraC-like DNA-binding protein